MIGSKYGIFFLSLAREGDLFFVFSNLLGRHNWWWFFFLEKSAFQKNALRWKVSSSSSSPHYVLIIMTMRGCFSRKK